MWYFDNEKKENLSTSILLTNNLKNNLKIQRDLNETDRYTTLGFNNKSWSGCFGVQCYINYDYLVNLQEKYNFFNLLKVVTDRPRRCCVERIFGVIIHNENKNNHKIKSLLGNITTYSKWGYTYDEHIEQLKKYKKAKYPLVKVWTGR